ncbi:zinc ribbon domain-containing protein [Paraburkholderia piptadeniae]|uniref:zinc ribbon domain-containing protein n=1 Tax=Paraburkholderia piptadeniae TaxID=1701573 RepID=UPI000B403203|nr:zinc ribbon domain-containing protein [Paraburkholderia piptadeniae]
MRAVERGASLAPVSDSDQEEQSSPAVVWPDISDPPPELPPPPFWKSAARSFVARGAALLVLVLAVGYAGYLRLGGDRHDDSGSVADSEAAVTAMSTSDGAVTSDVARPGSSRPAIVTGERAVNTAALAVAAPPRAVQYGRGVPAALRDAHASLEQNDLTAAKAAVAEVLSVAPHNADALQMRSDIGDRENQRDVALGVANACARDRVWSCVLKQASQALTVDSSSTDAKALLQRAIRSTGWKPLAASSTVVSAPRDPPRPVAGSAPALPTQPALPTLPPLPPGIPADSTPSPVTNDVVHGDRTAMNRASAAGDGLDAQARAIRDSGWRQPSPPDAADSQ